MTEPTDRAAVLMEAGETARTIAKRCRDNARTKTGDDRKHWAAGASMVALRLAELADAALETHQ